MNRVPIRLRLTAAFALAMAVVFAVAGFFLYHRLATSLDRTLDQGLRARSADISLLVQQADAGLRESSFNPGNASSFAQVLDTHGRIYDHTPGLGTKSLLTPAQFTAAKSGPLTVARTHSAGSTEAIRLFTQPVRAQGTRLVVVVGTPLETRDDALATLRTELLVGAPIALLLASLLGYVVAAGALRPVERMRSRVTAISGSRLGDRLPVAPSGDEISRLGETLNDMLARIETAMERERSFVADASHELRTPLAHLQAEVELALESPRSHDELETALRSVASETDRLAQLAEDLLLLARVEEGTLPIRRQDVRVDELLNGIARRFERRAREEGREIEVDANGAHLNVDRLRVEQALGNLVENALRYGEGTIRLAAGGQTLRVSDEGPGFPPGFAPRAFERFSRADDSRGPGGAGLGLAIVAAVAEAHGGGASVAGAVVTIRLP
ncbi:MAG TPA: ATP-binding protein [Gaiellaceae bacterium]|nr:ATP-binding protein [Gaiellaceae bacterium]